MEASRKSTPCANYRISGCEEVVTKRGNILCEKCRGARQAAIQNKKTQDDKALQRRANEMEAKLLAMKKEYDEKVSSYDSLVEDLERQKSELANEIDSTSQQYSQRINQLSSEKERMIETHLSEIKSVKTQSEEDVKKLELKLKLMQIKNDELKFMNEQSGSTSTTLQDEISTQEELNQKLSSINNEFVEENKALQQTKDELVEQNQLLDDENKRLQIMRNYLVSIKKYRRNMMISAENIALFRLDVKNR
jgi:chromosome segregation ATPase